MKQFNKSNISEIEDNLVGIYMIKNNITNKYYIGQSLELKSSLKKHLSSYNTKSKKNLYPLYISINKHGIENFTFQVLFYEPKDINNISKQRENLDNLEEKYILEYNSYGSTGYNQTAGMRSAKGTYDYKFIDAQKENLSNIQKQLVEEKDQVVYVYDIDNKLEYEFRNSIKFKRHFNIEESYQIKTQEYTRTKSGVAITKERFLISDSKEDLERQIKIFKDLKIDSHTNQGQFGKKNILAYNYILDKYFEFDSLSEMSRRTGKTISRISGILNRSSRSDDGWIIAQTKEHLERIKVRKNPSTKVKERYAKLEVIVSD